MSRLWMELRYSLRTLSKNKAFACVAILTLGLGIGANTAIFSVLYGVLLRPLPMAHPERLFEVALDYRGRLDHANFTFHQFSFLKENSRWCESLAASTREGFNLSTGQESLRIRALRVSSGYFAVFSAHPILGRDFTVEDDQRNGPNVAILSHGLWRDRFGGDKEITGKAIHLNGEPYTVIGVMPGRFDDLQQAELWTTLAPVASTIGSGSNLDIVAKLKQNVTAAQAKAQIAALTVPFAKATSSQERINPEIQLSLYPLQQVVGADFSSYLWLVLGAVLLVLLIACANVANLLLARGIARSREVAVRAALGASRSQLIRQFVTESVVLSLLGGGLGLAIAPACLKWLLYLAPFELPRLSSIQLDSQAFLFGLGLAVLTGLLFGLLPAIHASRCDVNSALKASSGQTTASRGSNHIRKSLVVSEVALSLVLLVGAVLLGETFVNLLRVDPGFDAQHVVSAEIWLTGSRYRTTEQLSAFFDELAGEIKRIPGVTDVSVASMGQPLQTGGNMPVTVMGDPKIFSVDYRQITPDYFKALSIPLLKGRAFSDGDKLGSEPVAIVNQAFARRFLSNHNPLGALVKIPGEDKQFDIVGVTGDVKSFVGGRVPPTLYVPQAQSDMEITLLFDGWYPTHVFVRVAGAPSQFVHSVEQTIRTADPELPLGKVQPMDTVLLRSVALQRFMMSLVGAFAVLALLIAALGIYGVISYAVAQRTREMGIRMALGARSGEIMTHVLGQGLRLTVWGVAAGLAGTYALHRIVADMLYGVKPTDGVTLAGAVAFLLAVAVSACYIPARRATRVDPLVALRYE